MRHLIINRQPIRCDLDLGLFQRYRSGANLAVQIVFDEIFLMKAWFRPDLCICFYPLEYFLFRRW